MKRCERFEKAVNWLKIEGVIKKDREVATRMKADPSNVSRSIKGAGNYPTDNFLMRFNKAFDNKFDVAWLLTGEGPMLSTDSTTSSEAAEESDEDILDDSNSFRYYHDMVATAGDIDSITDSEIGQPYQRINFPGYEGCVAFNVSGESMLPTAKPKDIVLIDPHEVETIINGEIYFIVTRDGQRMIKRLRVLKPRHEGSPHLRCISDNPDKETYHSFDLDGEMVCHIYRVSGFISNTMLR